LPGGDEQRDYRQVGIIDARGRTASFTGAHCFDWAGDAQGVCCAAQGNTLAGSGVAARLQHEAGPWFGRFLSSDEMRKALTFSLAAVPLGDGLDIGVMPNLDDIVTHHLPTL